VTFIEGVESSVGPIVAVFLAAALVVWRWRARAKLQP